MEAQQLKDPLNKVSLIKDELTRSSMEASESEKVIQHLNQELKEAHDQANAGKQKCVELQGLLEEEKRASKHQTEESAKQMKILQTKLQKLQDEMENLRDQKDSTILSMRQDAHAGQEEMQVLCRSMEKASAEREHEVSALKGNLATLTTELEKWQLTANKYEREIDSLQANHQQQNQQRDKVAKQQASELEKLKRDCDSLQRECTSLRSEREQLAAQQQKEKSSLQSECTSLRSEKEQLLKKLQQLEKELDSCKKQSAGLSSTAEALEKTRADLEKCLSAAQEEHQKNSSQLHSLLEQSKTRTKELQKEYEETQAELSGLKERCEQAEQEKESLGLELQHCQASLKSLQEKSNQLSLLPPILAVVIGLVLALLYWCFGPLW
ncbi:sarcolemma associated protein b isoform X1 [Ictalurus furcatus]|uniref:sarcolemma associated protein b isoform X1 n=1 Tax=Ictalurus furcatus TaxID=66913 RepID=UPI00234FC5FF|nr:sarcolemma associated protein b isoform X1 [Ictalurus furcatus]